MWDESDVVGRVLQSSTTRLTVGCQPAIAAQRQAIPPFGAFVKVAGPPESRAVGGIGGALEARWADAITFGLVHNVSVEDDLFVRQLVAAGIQDEEYIADQRQRRQVPILVEVLLLGFGSPMQGAGAVTLEPRYYLPPQPPTTLDKVYTCNSAEIISITARHDWLRTTLAAPDVATDALVPAALRAAALARPPAQRQAYLVSAGRELARFLALEPIRLDGILLQLREPSSATLSEP
jgi:hypothetical protein